MSGNVCGYVVRGESPVPDAAITIVEGPSGHMDLSPVTDADGWFALDDLAAGRWVLRAHAPDGGTGRANVEVWDDSLSDVTVVLEELSRETEASDDRIEVLPDVGSEEASGPDVGQTPSRSAPARRGRRKRPGAGSIRGRVTDAVSGEAVPEAVVVVTDGPGPLPDVAVTTDADGVFAIPTLDPGDWSLRVEADECDRGELVVAVFTGRRVDVAVVLDRQGT